MQAGDAFAREEHDLAPLALTVCELSACVSPQEKACSLALQDQRRVRGGGPAALRGHLPGKGKEVESSWGASSEFLLGFALCNWMENRLDIDFSPEQNGLKGPWLLRYQKKIQLLKILVLSLV